MASRNDRRRKLQQLFAEFSGGKFLPDDDDSVYSTSVTSPSATLSRSHSLRVKSSGSVKLPDKQQQQLKEKEKQSEKEKQAIMLPSNNIFNKKASYRWLFEPDWLKTRKTAAADGNQAPETCLEEWLRGAFSRRFIRFKRYDLIMRLLAQHRPLPLMNSFSTNDLSAITGMVPSSNMGSSLSCLSNLHAIPASSSVTTANHKLSPAMSLRSLAQQQQEQLKSHVLGQAIQQQQRRLSGSLTNLTPISSAVSNGDLNDGLVPLSPTHGRAKSRGCLDYSPVQERPPRASLDYTALTKPQRQQPPATLKSNLLLPAKNPLIRYAVRHK